MKHYVLRCSFHIPTYKQHSLDVVFWFNTQHRECVDVQEFLSNVYNVAIIQFSTLDSLTFRAFIYEETYFNYVYYSIGTLHKHEKNARYGILISRLFLH